MGYAAGRQRLVVGVQDPFRRFDNAAPLAGLVLENQAVANELYVSVETVRTHVKNILRKLRAHDRTHAVSLAYQAGLLSGGTARLA